MTENTENVEEGKEVVSWEDQMKADAKAVVERERPALSFMSLKSGIMAVGGEPVEGNSMDCVIVAVVSEMVHYKEKWQEGVISRPDCYASGEGRLESLIPHEKVGDERYAPTCKECPYFVWGSDLGGGRGRECKERRKMALMPADGSAGLCILSIPGTSIKGWSKFVRGVVAETGMSPAGIITTIKVKPHLKNQFEVLFERIGEVPEDMRPTVMAQRAGALEVLLAPYPDLEDEEEAKPKPKSSRKY